MLKDVAMKYYKEQNYNCAETILRAGNEYYGLELHDRDMILVGGFGGGIQSGNTCGAVLSAVSILSMKYVDQFSAATSSHSLSNQNTVANSQLKMHATFSKKFSQHTRKNNRF